jgi:phage terminase large subunit
VRDTDGVIVAVTVPVPVSEADKLVEDVSEIVGDSVSLDVGVTVSLYAVCSDSNSNNRIYVPKLIKNLGPRGLREKTGF